jgi:trk system potassium uptake protein TrkH
VVLYRLAGRHVGLQDRFLLQENLGVSEGNNVFGLTRYILGIVLGIEFLGAGFLFLRWRAMMPSDEAAYLAIFHSISAFCNAGFDLFSGSMYEPLFGYQRDPWSLTVLGTLIFIGALGIPVVDDLVRSRGSGRLSLHTKLTLAITLFLTISGIVVFLIDAQLSNNVLGQMAWDEQFWVSSFSIISARTAGITIIPTDQLGEASKLILMVSMFIGGSPSSMAGGVSTSVAVVVALAMRATVRGEKQAVAFGRAMPQETILKAVAVMTVSTLVVVFITLIMLLLQSGDLLTVGFEVISAFSNTGYSIGLTGELTNVGKLLIAFVMFWGRLGPLTLVVVLAQRHHPSMLTYPEEKVIMG